VINSNLTAEVRLCRRSKSGEHRRATNFCATPWCKNFRFRRKV